MLPPGMGFNALSPRALEASKTAKLPRSYWAWDEILEMNKGGYWPYTPNTNLLYGLSEALDMLQSEGWSRYSRGIGAGPPRSAAPSAPGDCRCNALMRLCIPRCSPASSRRPRLTPTRCAN